MFNRPDFYLTSTETRNLFEPRECYIEKRIIADGRKDDYLMVKISPNIIGQPYGLGAKDIDRLMLAVRYSDSTLFPINEWPMYVYVCRLLDNIEEMSQVSSKDLQIIMLGELYKSIDEAYHAIEIYKKQINSK